MKLFEGVDLWAINSLIDCENDLDLNPGIFLLPWFKIFYSECFLFYTALVVYW